MVVDLIIFPSSYFSKNQVDEDLQAEYKGALDTGLFDIIIFGYESWFVNHRLILTSEPVDLRRAIYRGWMMKPDEYENFYNMLLNNNIQLITTPAEYDMLHIFPNVYKYFGNDTAKMKTYSLHDRINVNELKAEFSRFMVKDFVKSVKGTDFPKYFDSGITQEAFDKWMEVFYQYRGKLLTGGICIKEYLPLKYYGGKTNEYRVFYVNHQIATVSRNSAQPMYAPEVPRELIEKYNDLPSDYYTVDYAELEDNTWKLIEAGDGSVSGLSEGQSPEWYYRALYHCMN